MATVLAPRCASTEKTYQRFLAIDLRQIKKRLMKEGWSEEDADQGILWYKRFLYIIKMYPGETFTPPYLVDEVWHEHIIHMHDYRDMCEDLFGHLLYHVPNHDEDAMEEVHRCFDKLMDTFLEHFNETPPRYLAKCGHGRCSGGGVSMNGCN